MVSQRHRTIVYSLAVAIMAIQLIYISFFISVGMFILTGDLSYVSSLLLVCASMAYLLDHYMKDLIFFSKYDITKTCEDMKRELEKEDDDNND